MAFNLGELAKWFFPLSRETKQLIPSLESMLPQRDFKAAKRLLRLRRAALILEGFGETNIVRAGEFPQLVPAVEEEAARARCSEINKRIRAAAEKKALAGLDNEPWKAAEAIAPNLVGYSAVRQAVLLQLVSSEPLHILLLGDPGVGKTDILHDAAELSPVSSFGLGSGTSGAGLSAMYKGNKLVKGLLPLADSGLCCIDELNLMRDKDYAALYNAMEKGFITYTKGGKNIKIDARVNVLATANPKGDKFTGSSPSSLRKQLPFEPALLSRFHLVFFIKKPDARAFAKISKSLVSSKAKRATKQDREFIRKWVSGVREREAEFPESLKENIGALAEDLKKNEKSYLVEISPRTILGVMRLAKASAKLSRRKRVGEEDLLKAEEILFASLKW